MEELEAAPSSSVTGRGKRVAEEKRVKLPPKQQKVASAGAVEEAPSADLLQSSAPQGAEEGFLDEEGVPEEPHEKQAEARGEAVPSTSMDPDLVETDWQGIDSEAAAAEEAGEGQQAAPRTNAAPSKAGVPLEQSREPKAPSPTPKKRAPKRKSSEQSPGGQVKSYKKLKPAFGSE